MGWLKNKFLEIIQAEEEPFILKNKIKVKKLEWFSTENNLFKANTLGGSYFINNNLCSETCLSKYDFSTGSWLPIRYYSSLEEAMAEAQREFDQEILSYINMED